MKITYEQIVKDVAKKALDEILYEGKTIREWIKIIAEQELCEVYNKGYTDGQKALAEHLKLCKEEQEPKIGHWINGYCSECGCDVPAYIIDWKWQKDMDAKYCPNCGARMSEVIE